MKTSYGIAQSKYKELRLQPTWAQHPRNGGSSQVTPRGCLESVFVTQRSSDRLTGAIAEAEEEGSARRGSWGRE